MSDPEKKNTAKTILDAIRAKRERKQGEFGNTEALEASLLADIEAFDLTSAERKARLEYIAQSGAGLHDPTLTFPNIVPGGVAPKVGQAPVRESASAGRPAHAESHLLAALRHQAELRQHELHSEFAERTAANEAIDRALRQAFYYFHELVQQLNVLKPTLARTYPLIERYELGGFTWQEGFADYRTQSQSAGAMVELVSFSFRLQGDRRLTIDRDELAIERLRNLLFDYGLQFSCNEFRNARRHLERAEFQIEPQLSVTARWRADFNSGHVILETRNLERLGSNAFVIAPQCLDQALLDHFTRLVLGEPNQFRDLVRR